MCVRGVRAYMFKYGRWCARAREGRERRPVGEKAFSRREDAAFGGGDHVQLAMIFAFFAS